MIFCFYNVPLLICSYVCKIFKFYFPFSIIYNHLKSTDAKSKESVGIQIMGVVMACKFPPYGPVAPVDRDRSVYKQFFITVLFGKYLQSVIYTNTHIIHNSFAQKLEILLVPVIDFCTSAGTIGYNFRHALSKAHGPLVFRNQWHNCVASRNTDVIKYFVNTVYMHSKVSIKKTCSCCNYNKTS